MDEDTGTLVICNTSMVIFLRDYRRLVTEEGYEPELEAYIDLTSPMGTPPEDLPGDDDDSDSLAWEWDDELGQEAGSWEQTGTTLLDRPCHSTLSVADGRALVVNQAPILFDFAHLPTRPEDIRATLLWPEPSGGVDEPGLHESGSYQVSFNSKMLPGGNRMLTLRQARGVTHDGGEGPHVSDYQVVEQWDFASPLVQQARQASPPEMAPWTVPARTK